MDKIEIYATPLDQVLMVRALYELKDLIKAQGDNFGVLPDIDSLLKQFNEIKAVK
jgi:hypothetical protein